MKTNKILSIIIIIPVIIFLAYLTLSKNLSSGDTTTLVCGIVILVALLTAMINIESIKEFGLSKQGLVLKTTIEEAKNLIEQMKNLAVLISAPVANTVSYGGCFGFHFTEDEFLNFREETIKLFDTMQLSPQERIKTMDILDNRVISTLLRESISHLSQSKYPIDKEKQSKYNNLHNIAISNTKNKVKKFEEKLAELNESLTPERKEIIEEAKYFEQHKTFKDYPLIKSIFK